MNCIDSLDVRIRELESSMTAESESTEAAEMLISLKMQRNSLTPFVALPEDVLIQVASCLLIAPSPSLPAYIPRSPGAHSILSVCHDVRQVLVSTPLLWVHIDMGRSMRWCKLCLERAGTATLSLSYCPPQTTSENSWSFERRDENNLFFLELLPRAAHVSVHGPKWTLPLDIVMPLFRSAWPRMQTLDLRTERIHVLLTYHPHAFSALRTLCLEDAALVDAGVRFPALQHLQISRSQFSTRTRSTLLYHTLRIVDHSPALRSLAVYGYYPCLQELDPGFRRDASGPRSLDALRVELDYVDTRSNDWTPLLTFLATFHAPRKECAVRFAHAPYQHLSEGDWVLVLMRAAMLSCTMHIHLLPELIRAHRVTLTADAAGTQWTIGMERCQEPKWLPEDMLALVKTLHVGKGSALHLFRGAASHLWPNALASVQHVFIEGAQSELGYFKQWLHVRVYAGRRVHTVEFCASLVYPNAWTLAVLKQDILEMKLAEVVIGEVGVPYTVADDQVVFVATHSGQLAS
jgi:hypothetical protein